MKSSMINAVRLITRVVTAMIVTLLTVIPSGGRKGSSSWMHPVSLLMGDKLCRLSGTYRLFHSF
jgi:hypothetical protein